MRPHSIIWSSPLKRGTYLYKKAFSALKPVLLGRSGRCKWPITTRGCSNRWRLSAAWRWTGRQSSRRTQLQIDAVSNVRMPFCITLDELHTAPHVKIIKISLCCWFICSFRRFSLTVDDLRLSAWLAPLRLYDAPICNGYREGACVRIEWL